jgi:hypothetical protein
VIEEVGPGVTDLTPGDEVYYTPEVFGPDTNKAYAEYHVAAASIVAKKPASLSRRRQLFPLPEVPRMRRSCAGSLCESERRYLSTVERGVWALSPSR